MVGLRGVVVTADSAADAAHLLLPDPGEGCLHQDLHALVEVAEGAVELGGQTELALLGRLLR